MTLAPAPLTPNDRSLLTIVTTSWQSRPFWWRLFTALVVALLILSFELPALARTKGGEEALVKHFYPKKWRQGTIPPGMYTYANADLDGPGKGKYVVAAYSNGFSGMVRVIKMQGKIPHLLASTSYQYMIGSFPTLTLVDVDGDGRPEVDVSFAGADGRNNSDWILKWNGSALHSIGPVTTDSNGYISTELNSPAFVDLFGNGKLDIINSEVANGDSGPVSAGTTVSGLVHGHYKHIGTEYYVKFYRRKKGEPIAKIDTFPAATPKAACVMTVVNGSEASRPVRSAVIKLNGATVVSRNQINPQTRIIKIPVTLHTSNTLSVTLRGAPGSVLTVVVIKPQ